jgi:(p)ppGpp synthase/HD superfamily hydrolase
MSAQAQLIAAFVKLIEGPLTLPKAVAIATVCHGNAEDKGKNSYIRHPLRLIEKQETEDEMMVAVLHDVVEDTFKRSTPSLSWTFSRKTKGEN